MLKQTLLLISFIALLLNCQSQSDNKIVIGKIDSINSKILNENRKIWIYVPEEVSIDSNSKHRFPVVYLLDGDTHFTSVAGMIQLLSTVRDNMVCPEMIVVGIPNTDRTRDLTPTHVVVDPPFMDSASSKNSGGGERFISFIEKELMPYIDKQYPTEPYKMLIGHSFGGLTVMQIFVHHTDLFNSYICVDPSMWWDKQTLLKETKKLLASKKFQGTSIFLGIANTMEQGMNINKVVKDTSAESIHIRSILLLKRYFENYNQNGLKYQGKYYENDSHGSVPLITEYDAIRFFFNYYNLKLSIKDYSNTSSQLVGKFEKHFSNVSKQMGYKVKPSENLLKRMGYQALTSKQYKKASSFFKYNISNYPESYNVYESMGDYYETIGDIQNAIIYFEKAFSIKENTDTRKKIEKLKLLN